MKYVLRFSLNLKMMLHLRKNRRKVSWTSKDDRKMLVFPTEVCSFQELEVLRLREGQIASLPPQISRLCLLQQMNLYHNWHVAIPPQIGLLSNLTKLVLVSLQTLP